MPSLYVKQYGGTEPPDTAALLVHGLFGSHTNLGSLASALCTDYSVYSVDLRNHGRSFHHEDPTLPAMAGDLVEVLNLVPSNWLLTGHSLGGQVLMQLLLSRPDLHERIKGAVFIDIGPYRGGDSYEPVLQLYEQDVSVYDTREDVEKMAADYIADRAMRSFLLTNLQRGPDGFSWRINTGVLIRAVRAAGELELPDSVYPGRVLCIRGSESRYVKDEKEDVYRRYFPAVEFITIQGAGHWPHFSHTARVARAITDWAG